MRVLSCNRKRTIMRVLSCRRLSPVFRLYRNLTIIATLVLLVSPVDQQLAEIVRQLFDGFRGRRVLHVLTAEHEVGRSATGAVPSADTTADTATGAPNATGIATHTATHTAASTSAKSATAVWNFGGVDTVDFLVDGLIDGNVRGLHELS